MIRTLKTRIAVWYITLSAIIMIGFGLTVYFTLSRSLYKERESLIREDRAVIQKLIAEHERGEREGFLHEFDEHIALMRADEFVQVFSPTGKSLYRSPSLKGRQLPFKPELVELTRSRPVEIDAFEDDQDLLMTMAPAQVSGDNFLIAIATSLAPVNETNRRLLIILLLSVPVAIILALIGGVLLARRAIDPIDQITATASQITADNLGERIRLDRADEELQRLAQAFNQMIMRLEDSFTRIRQFTADASHELRTPLAIIKGETQVALAGNLPQSEYHQVLTSRLEELERMNRIVDDLLVLSRFDANESVLDPHNTDFSDLVIETCEQMHPAAAAKQLTLSLERIEPVELFGDSLRLRQMLRNLLDNAIKYTASGGKIMVEVERSDLRTCRVVVSDTGMGIPEKDLPLIFDRFYRVDKARSRDLGGSGLGLSIVKRIIEAHGGKISVDSEPGIGTKFTIDLPALSSIGNGKDGQPVQAAKLQS